MCRYRPQWAVKLARIGLKRNWPDILVLFGRLARDRTEAPRRGVEPRPLGADAGRGAPRYVEGQRDVFPRLEAAGMKLATCHSVVDVLDQLAAWGVPLRGRIAA